MWKKFTKSIGYLLRSETVDEPKKEGLNTEACAALLKELGILFEAEEGEGNIEFMNRLEKEHPNSRIYYEKRNSIVSGLVCPEGYALHEWIEHRVKESTG